MARKVREYEVTAGNLHLPDGVVKKEGQRFHHELPLDEMWPAKVARVDRTLEEDEPEGTKPKAKSKVKAKTTKEVEPEDEDVEEEEAKPKGKADKKSKAKAADEEVEGEDMTGDYPDAKANDLKVLYVKSKGYTIYDGKKAVNEKPIRDGKLVAAEIKRFVGTEE